jgi:hypothetical protein
MLIATRAGCGRTRPSAAEQAAQWRSADGAGAWPRTPVSRLVASVTKVPRSVEVMPLGSTPPRSPPVSPPSNDPPGSCEDAFEHARHIIENCSGLPGGQTGEEVRGEVTDDAVDGVGDAAEALSPVVLSPGSAASCPEACR